MFSFFIFVNEKKKTEKKIQKEKNQNKKFKIHHQTAMNRQSNYVRQILDICIYMKKKY